MKTLVLGASANSVRYSNMAARRLLAAGHEVVLVGNRAGFVEAEPIADHPIVVAGVHTVTLYLNPERQKPYYGYLLDEIRPVRIIYNPGTENAELMELAAECGIHNEIACTLVMLGSSSYEDAAA